jgi:hypothetical protein
LRWRPLAARICLDMCVHRAMPRAAVRALAVLMLLSGATAFAAPDYTDLLRDETNYFVVMDKLAAEVPNVSDAPGRVGLLESWTAANDGLCNAGEALLKRNPDILSGGKPPPEFAGCYERCSAVRTNYVAMLTRVGTLIKQYGTNATVAASVKRWQYSLMRRSELANLGEEHHD